MSNTERHAFMRKSNPRIYSQLEDNGQKATKLPLFCRLGRKNLLPVRTKSLAATAVNPVAFVFKGSTAELSNMYWLVKYVAGIVTKQSPLLVEPTPQTIQKENVKLVTATHHWHKRVRSLYRSSCKTGIRQRNTKSVYVPSVQCRQDLAVHPPGCELNWYSRYCKKGVW
jgi:hypothetical protein